MSRKTTDSSSMIINTNGSTILPPNVNLNSGKITKKQGNKILETLNIKLDQHKSEIQARDDMIEQITVHIENLRIDYLKEK